MFLACVIVNGEEFLATGDTPEEGYKHLQEITECNAEDVTFFELKPYPVKCTVAFEPY